MLYPQNGGRIVAIDTVTPLRPMYRASNSTGIISGTLRRLYGVRGTNCDDMAALLSHVHTVAAGGCRAGADFVAAVLMESSITMKVESSVRRRRGRGLLTRTTIQNSRMPARFYRARQWGK